MKMTRRLVVVLLALLSATAAQAQDDDPAAAVEGKIRAMYREIGQGDFEAALGGKIMIGASGFLRDGLLREVPDEGTMAMVVGMYEEAYGDGMRIELMPSHINVKASDRGAIATFLIEGQVTEPNSGETMNVLDRASHLWLNVEGAWKLAHFHYSRLTIPDEVEGDDDHEDHDDDDDDHYHHDDDDQEHDNDDHDDDED